MHILPCKQERLYTYGEIGGTLAESLSYVLSTLEGSSDTFGHYFSDIIYTSARDSNYESIGRGAYSQRRMVYVSYPGAVSKANVGISNDKEG